MGEGKSRLEQFLSAHPTCCFCGGSTAAVTRDHLPPRTVFRDKKWPQGYEFPACMACNGGSAKHDAIFGALSRFNSADEHPRDRDESNKLLKAFKEQHPDAAASMRLTANEKRQMLQREGVAIPKGTSYGEVRLVQIPDIMDQAALRLAEKLVRALHYKHSSGRIVPVGAFTKVRWWSNVQMVSGKFPRELFKVVPGQTQLRRDHVDLGSQFSYRYGVSEDGTLGAYLAFFRRAFTTFGLVCFDGSLIDDPEAAMRLSETALGAE